MAEVTDLLAALGKSLGAFFTDPNRSPGRLAPVSHDERMNLKTADEMNHEIGFPSPPRVGCPNQKVRLRELWSRSTRKESWNRSFYPFTTGSLALSLAPFRLRGESRFATLAFRPEQSCSPGAEAKRAVPLLQVCGDPHT